VTEGAAPPAPPLPPPGGLVESVVRRPYVVAVAVILAVLFSSLSITRIPVQLKPTVDVPRITVRTSFRGAGAVEVEEQLTRELEEELQRTEGLVKMTSDSADGLSTITLEFDYGRDLQAAVVDVLNKLTRVPSLPTEADEPLVEVTSEPGPGAVMWIALESPYPPGQVRRVLDEDIEPRLERQPGVAGLFIVGGAEREVQVRLDPEALVARGVTVAQVGDALSRANVNLRGGTIETPGRQLVVRTVGRAEAPALLEGLVVRKDAGGTVHLRDVARVIDTTREQTEYARINGKPGIAIGVQRRTGANVVTVISGVDEEVEAINADFRARGVAIALVPVYRETTYIYQAIDFVLENLWQGGLLAILALLVFLRAVRPVVFVILVIPVCLVTVFPILLVLGRSLNVISLAGIAFASGTIVDNAIVVLENVYRHLQLGKTRMRAAIDGGREVWGGLLASTLTTVAVFAPVILESDEASQTFVDIALAISAANVVSLFVTVAVLPILAAYFGPKADSRETTRLVGGGRLDFLGRAYERSLVWLTRPGAIAGKAGVALLVLTGCVVAIGVKPPAEYLPTGNRNLIFFFASPVAGTRPSSALDNLRPLESFLLAQKETERVFLVNTPTFSGGGAVLKPEYATAEDLDAFHKRLFPVAGSLAGFQFVVPIRSSIFQDPGKQFEVELTGPDFAALERGSLELQQRLMALDGVQFVRSSLVTGRPELHVHPDPEKAERLGLTVSEIGDVVETAVAGRRRTILVQGGREVDVNVLVAPERLASRTDLEDLPFLSPERDRVTLGAVADVERTSGPLSVRRLERERSVLLTVNLRKEAPLQTVIEKVEGELFPASLASLGPAYRLRLGGAADKLKTTLGSLTRGLWLSILIVYLLLVALFSSWFTPLVILVSVPLALAGGIFGIALAHHFSGGQASFDVIAMLGFVILAGIVVNNAILIVHQMNNLRAEGMPPRRALVESASTRLRPILMSVITSVVGMWPLAAGGGAGAELYQGLGAVLVGGLLLSTVFTLFLVPVLVSIGHDLRRVPAE
jgi:hydrophobic/amphiphilic exporter-1 (mainly G- bacteria), HAE1 family